MVTASSTGNSIEFSQNRFKDTYEAARDEYKKLSREAIWRRVIAYFLKGIAIFGGIAIAAGLRENWAHGVGILITVAVGIDLLFSNHQRLLIITEGANAYKNLLKDTEHSYNIKLGKIIADRKKIGDEAAKEKLERLITTVLDKLYGEQKKIETALQEADLKALKTIKLQHSLTASSTGS